MKKKEIVVSNEFCSTLIKSSLSTLLLLNIDIIYMMNLGNYLVNSCDVNG